MKEVSKEGWTGYRSGTPMEAVTDHVVHGDEVHISCADGYRGMIMIHDSTRTLCDAGTFTPPLQTCEQCECHPPKFIPC